MLRFYDLFWSVYTIVVGIKLKLLFQCVLHQLRVDIRQNLMGQLFVWKIVFTHNLFYQFPFLDGLLANLFDTTLAQILNFRFVGVAYIAEVFEMDVDDKVFRDDFVFVLSDVFWAQLHFPRFNIVASLDEGCIEHYAKDELV